MMLLKEKKLVLAAFAALALAAACSSSTPSGSTPDYAGSCSELASKCHGIASTVAKECHDLGHDGDDARCGPRKVECLAACPEGARDAGKDAPAEAGDAGGDAAVDPSCTAYCTCMKASCGSEKNYPFTDESVCYAACATFTAAERTCFTGFCREATDSGAKEHECDHATGKLGMAECP